jgi:hypothetical protein
MTWHRITNAIYWLLLVGAPVFLGLLMTGVL